MYPLNLPHLEFEIGLALSYPTSILVFVRVEHDDLIFFRVKNSFFTFRNN